MENEISVKQPKKSKRRKWIRYERKHSNSMWHTDYKHLDDGRLFLCYLDDASRFVVGYGVFEHETTENALVVLRKAMAKYGKPASILTDHGSQFYANDGEKKKKGESVYEEELLKLGIKHILARVRHPQTNGKLEYLHGKIQRKLPHFETLVGHDKAVDTFMNLYNYEWIHMSLDETPWESYQRKKAPEGTIDSEAEGESC